MAAAGLPPFTIKWGIMSTGHIAANFARDLLTDPGIRGVHDIRHRIVAVASSTSPEKAIEFLLKIQLPAGEPVKTYGSYMDLVADPNVDIVYIATPASHHFQNTMLALQFRKHVLCEKPFTMTTTQAATLVATARAKQLFLMEALWTRFFPLSVQVQELVSSDTIGTIYRVIADNSINRSLDDGSLGYDPASRMVNPDLGGGAMLDMGVYALSWVLLILYHLQPERAKEPPAAVVSAINKYYTGVDESTSFVVTFPIHGTMGIGMTTLRVGSGVDYNFTGGAAIKIQGSKGEIQICGPPFRPLQYRIILKDGHGAVQLVDCPIPGDRNRDGWGRGLFWEADECARCVRDGMLESNMLPLQETVVGVEVMEAVVKQGGVCYPETITSDVYNPQSPLNMPCSGIP
ncbi:hypothetical protein GE09DRAFT_1165992 [Coniochaeta sp. 2T2.1]|nr:hypothetical protein GE09DRAFT_1165992 [Coniochaeta sp. 2T2.1]